MSLSFWVNRLSTHVVSRSSCILPVPELFSSWKRVISRFSSSIPSPSVALRPVTLSAASMQPKRIVESFTPLKRWHWCHIEAKQLNFVRTNFFRPFLLPMGFLAWFMETKIEDVHDLDRSTKLSEGKRTPEEVEVENLLLSVIWWLPDSEWSSNWDYLMQTMMRIALSRQEDRDPAYGVYSARLIHEQIISKRKLLPADQNVAVGMITVYNNLSNLYMFDQAWEPMVEANRLLIDELQNLEVGRVPEQISFAFLRMAAAYNLNHDLQNAKWALDQCFSAFQLQTLPPHRFKAHLMNIIELCYHHDRSEQPQFLGIHFNSKTRTWVPVPAQDGESSRSAQHLIPGGDPTKIEDFKPTISFLSQTQAWYETLQTQLPTVRLDHPWSRILDDIDAKVMQQLSDTKDQLTEQGQTARLVTENQRAMNEKLRYYMNEILSNPNYTPNQRIGALKRILEEHVISDEDEKKINAFIRKLRVAVAIPEDYIPKEHAERVNRVRY